MVINVGVLCLSFFFNRCSLLRYITVNRTVISPISYVDVSVVCVCVIPFEKVCLLCAGSVMYWSVWVLTTFRVWRARVGGWGGGDGGLWAVGFQEGVKDFIGKYGMVIQMVVGYVLSMDVKPLDHV